MPTCTITNPNGDVVLAQALPEAEYMYGCTPTAIAMVLGYYDLYGYRETDLSNMIEGDVDSKSRGTDGNAYNMNAFDTALGRATATESFVSRFHSRGDKETTPSQELKYTFKSDKKTIDTSVWDCIADYLGTGQYWRGNDNLSTTLTYGTLEDLYGDNSTFEITSGSTTRTIRHIDTAMLYGLDLYVQSRGYAMDYEITGSYVADVAGGNFSFDDYMREIDAGRPVMISVQGHSMAGYGYNADTQEIIFDDCYVSGRRMKWDGTYRYDKVDRKLQGITVIGINVNGSVNLAIENIAGSEWKKLVVADAPDASENADYCFAGNTVYLNFTVSNRGTNDSGGFSVTVRVDGETVSSGTVDALDGESSRNMQNIPLNELTIGLHNVRVVLDEANDIQELSGSDNAAETDVLVLKPGTSIVPSSQMRIVDSGEKLTDVYVQGGANLTITDGEASGVVLRGTVTESTAEKTVWTPAEAIVSRGGSASGTDVYGHGVLEVSSGGTAVETHVFSRGSAFVLNGGAIRDASVESGGRLTVFSGGRLTGQIRLEDGAVARVSSGGILNFDISTLAPGAPARVNDLSLLTGAPACTLTVSGTQEYGTYRLAEGAVNFKKTVAVTGTDGAALGTLALGETAVINGADYKLNLDGGTLALTVGVHVPVDSVAPTVSGLHADITEPTCRSVTLTAVFDDDTALASRLYRIGENGTWTEYTDEGVAVTENAVVFFKAVDASGNESEIARYEISNITSSGCVLSGGQTATVLPGRTYADMALSGGSMWVSSGGTANGTTVCDGGRIYVSSGGTANGTVLDSGGDLSVFPHGAANGTTVKSSGYLEIYSGAVADGVTVNDSGTFVVYAGGRITGLLSFAPGAHVSMEPLSGLDFDISARKPGTEAQVNGLSLVQGTPDYTLTVSGSQKKGLYLLADGADGFDAEVAVRDASGSLLGVLEPGQTVDINGAGFSLNLSDNALSLSIGAAGVDNAADCGWNNWLYNKKTKLTNPKIKDSDPVVLNADTTTLSPDSPGSVSQNGRRNFVGFGDEADFMKIKLDSAAKLSFLIDADGASKFVVCRLVEGKDKKGNPTYTMKALRTTALTKKKKYSAASSPLLLEKGEYYISVQSTNMKTTGSAYYNVTLNPDEEKTVFYSDGDDGGNNWLYDKKKSAAPNSFVRDSEGIAMKTGCLQIDETVPADADGAGWNNFVGFGDAVDYAKLDLACTAKVKFTISATNAAKFTVYRLVEGTDSKGKPTYKLKTVLTKTLKKQKNGDSYIYAATTKTISLPAVENGEYFISVRSTAAKKGKCAYYNVTLDTFEPAGSARLLMPDDGPDACAPGPADASALTGGSPGLQTGPDFGQYGTGPMSTGLASLPDPAPEEFLEGTGSGILAAR